MKKIENQENVSVKEPQINFKKENILSNKELFSKPKEKNPAFNTLVEENNTSINHEVKDNCSQSDILIEIKCRICDLPATCKNKIITPCQCTGKNKYVHNACLSKWIKSKDISYEYVGCDICGYNFRIKPVYKRKINKNNFSIILKKYISICVLLFGIFYFLFYAFIRDTNLIADYVERGGNIYVFFLIAAGYVLLFCVFILLICMIKNINKFCDKSIVDYQIQNYSGVINKNEIVFHKNLNNDIFNEKNIIRDKKLV